MAALIPTKKYLKQDKWIKLFPSNNFLLCTNIPSTQQDKIHNIWHQIENYQACEEENIHNTDKEKSQYKKI